MPEQIASNAVVEDVTDGSMTLSFDNNDNISRYTVFVDRIDEATGEATREQEIVVDLEQSETRRTRLASRILADVVSCPGKTNADAVQAQIQGLQPASLY